jgi:succinoglycan biosynthesis protein ExoL
MIRCAKSLALLDALARKLGGGIEVIVRGRPSDAVFPDFAASLKAAPHIRFGGPYRNPEDLGEIYGDVHFNWTIDYYESGQNSSWLLPNRVYEGSAYGAVPIALAKVETANWLAQQRAGVVLEEPLEESLAGFFTRLGATSYARLAREVEALPGERLIDDRSACLELVRSLCGRFAAARPGGRYLEAPA